MPPQYPRGRLKIVSVSSTVRRTSSPRHRTGSSDKGERMGKRLLGETGVEVQGNAVLARDKRDQRLGLVAVQGEEPIHHFRPLIERRSPPPGGPNCPLRQLQGEIDIRAIGKRGGTDAGAIEGERTSTKIAAGSPTSLPNEISAIVQHLASSQAPHGRPSLRRREWLRRDDRVDSVDDRV